MMTHCFIHQRSAIIKPHFAG